MQYQTSRKLAKTVHFSIALVQLLYVYTPIHNWEYALTMVQWVTFPLLFLSGLWLVKGKNLWLWKNANKHDSHDGKVVYINKKAA